MINWIITLIIAIIVGVIGIIFLTIDPRCFFYEHEICQILTIIFIVILFSFIIMTIGLLICASHDYNMFVLEYENVKNMYENMSPKYTEAYFHIIDVFDINEELIFMQSKKEYWGNWSVYPDSVLELTPIGLE